MTIFTNQAAAVAEFRSRSAATVQLGSWLRRASDDLVYAKLLAAEREFVRRVGVLLEPTKIFCEDDVTQAQIDALNGAPYAMDPGYDYVPESFAESRWAFLQTRRRPIISVERYAFVYVSTQSSLWNVPQSWLRLDKKYGTIRILPSADVVTLPLNTYLLSVFGNGRVVPNMIRLEYTAGVKDVATEYPDLWDFLFRVAALLAIMDQFPGGSASISADGLSETEAFSIADWTDTAKGAIEAQYRNWKTFFNGVMLAVA